VFTKACSPAWEQREIEKEWFRILGELFPDTQLDALSPTQWAAVMEQAPAKIVPF
jgi:hypothetical protein